MQVFNEYLQPLINWLHLHPELALFITFFIALTESLAIIGSIIPGSVTMTAIGILAGSGVMRIDLTLFSAALGAIAGDSASYFLGYILSDKLINIWPFRKYPNLLIYGKEYFAKHGGKSVLIGRFVGPLRSIIPVIAGMLHMKQWQFLFANIVSGIAWAFLYVGPGILIGSASNELSTESATRLFLFTLALLLAIWLAGIALKHLIIFINTLLNAQLNSLWHRALKNTKLQHLLKWITPKNEKNHTSTAALVSVIIACILSIISLSIWVHYSASVTWLNQPILAFFQNLRTNSFDIFFVSVSLAISPLALMLVSFSLFLSVIYHRDWRLALYIISLISFSMLSLYLISSLLDIPRPVGLLKTRVGPSFPSLDLSYATSLYLFMLAVLKSQQSRVYTFAKILIISLLLSVGFAEVYLGDNWFVDILLSYIFGLGMASLYWLLYRRLSPLRSQSYLGMCFLIALLFSALFSISIYFKVSLKNHRLLIAQFVLTPNAWWQQEAPLLPLYCTNRVGNRLCLLNIQYVGPLNKLKAALIKEGWNISQESFITNFLKKINAKHPLKSFTWMTQLYRHKKPSLTLIYEPINGGEKLTLSLWRSNYHLYQAQQPIWLASLHTRAATLQNATLTSEQALSPQLFTYLLPSLKTFTIRKIHLPSQTTIQGVIPEILIIRDSAINLNFNQD